MSPDNLNPSQQQAREIEQQQPGWMVIYGEYSKEYVAFPLFSAPPRTILAAAYPPALIQRIQQTERWLHRKPHHHGEP